jgi:phage-related protein
MKTSGAIVYWIDPNFGIQSAVILPHQISKGTTYEWEASYRTGDAKYVEVIMLDRAGNPAEKARVDRLKQKATELRQAAKAAEPRA